MKSKYIIGGLVALLFGGVALYALMPSTTMYVTFAQAREKGGQNVQVIGKPDMNSIQYNRDKDNFTFVLKDQNGEDMKVLAQGPPPTDRMDDAEQIVVKGAFSEGIFQATELLLKCPSKYKKRMQQ